jgi:signal transduction histidine kinase
MEVGTRGLEDALNETTAILWAYDADGLCTLCKGGGLRALGLEASDFEGHNLLALYPEDTLPGGFLRRALSGESFATDYEREPGIVVQTTYQPVRDADGSVVGGIALTVDVTHRRAREEEAQRAAVLAQISRDLADHARQPPHMLAQAIAETVSHHVGGTALLVEFDDAGLFTDLNGIAGPDDRVVDAVRRALPLWRTILGWGAGEDTLLQGRSIMLDHLPADLTKLMEERLDPELIRELAVETLLVAPTRDAGKVNGIIVVLRGPEAPAPTELECELLEEIAERTGLALSNARLLETAAQLMADRRALLGHLIDAEEGERRRIAHDIHDDTIQVLAAVDLRLQLLRRRLSARTGGEDEVEVLDALRESTQAATSRLRRLLFELQPPALENAGVGAALRQLADDLYADSGIACTVTDRLTESIDESTASVLFRVGKEALINARKHSHARAVHVTLSGDADGMRLSVVDDGLGLPTDDSRPDNWPHLGLETMRDRAQLAGGSLTLRPTTGGGTTVDLWIPPVRPGPR